MKPSTVILFATLAALLAVSATAWPHPHPHFPFPKGRGGAFPPLPPLPSMDDVAKCRQAVRGSDSASCFPLSYNETTCCTYLSGLEVSCGFVAYYQSQLFKGIVAHVCPAPPSA